MDTRGFLFGNKMDSAWAWILIILLVPEIGFLKPNMAVCSVLMTTSEIFVVTFTKPRILALNIAVNMNCSQKSVHTAQQTISVSGMKTNALMLYIYIYMETVSVSSKQHIKHTDAFCGQDVEFFNVNRGGI
jgi:hypothetical protein